MFDFLYEALGWLMKQIYELVNNYGFAIILFTVITKILLFPLNLKQQKSSAQLQKIKPQLDEIQKKYANNREKMSEETMKLYQEYGINPAGGCLPLLIQLPIIFALYKVIERPYTYILGWGAGKFQDLEKFVGRAMASEREEITFVNKAIEKGAEVAETINFDFFGLSMASAPNQHGLSPMLIIPAVAAILTFVQSKCMYAGLPKEEKKQKANGRPPRPGDKNQSSAEQSMGAMTYFMPVMTLFFTYSLPAGIGLYWITGSVVQIILTFISNRFIIPNMKTKVVQKGGQADDIEEIRKKLREKRQNSGRGN